VPAVTARRPRERRGGLDHLSGPFFLERSGMLTALVVIFVIAYAAIVLEHPIRINKSASALVAAGLLWTVYAISLADPTKVASQLSESVTATAQIVFFLMGAMTIVEVVDAHNGFDVITQRIKTSKLSIGDARVLGRLYIKNRKVRLKGWRTEAGSWRKYLSRINRLLSSMRIP
jgi:hypothetical protein